MDPAAYTERRRSEGRLTRENHQPMSCPSLLETGRIVFMREQTFQLTDEEVRNALGEYLVRHNRVLGAPPGGWLRVEAWRDRDRFIVNVTDPREPMKAEEQE